MSIFEALECHRDRCFSCWSGSPCEVAQELITRLAEQLVPCTAPEILDLAAHERACEKCRDHTLCSVGQRIAFEATSALLTAASEGSGLGKA